MSGPNPVDQFLNAATATDTPTPPDPRDTIILQLEDRVEGLQDELMRQGARGGVTAAPEAGGKPQVHVPIGDSHNEPGVPVTRFLWLARHCAEVEADVVVDIGDFWSMDSLCSYDRGQRCFEGRRYWKDIDVGMQAQDLFAEELNRLGLSPTLHRTLGNHENRISRMTQLEAILEGVVGIGDLRSMDFGWTEHKFLQPVCIDGINYVHYLTMPGSGRAVSGVSIARQILLKGHESIVVGHTHRFDYQEELTVSNKKIIGLNVGCYFSQYLPYAGAADNARWKRGIATLRNVVNGEFDMEWVGLDEMERRYGD